MFYQEYAVPLVLAPYVETFWSLDFRLEAKDLRVERVLPDGRTELIIHYGDTFQGLNRSGSFETQARGLFVGQMKQHTLLKTAQTVGMIAARFKPNGASRFFDFPQNEILNQAFDLESLIGDPGRILVEKVLEASDYFSRVTLLSGFLIQRAERGKRDPLIEAAVNLIKSKKDFLDSNLLSKKIGLSERQLERKFKQQIGLGPQALARIFRFQDAISKIQDSTVNLTELALNCGYYDHAHFIKDFKSFSGLTPTEYLKEQHELSDNFTHTDKAD